MKQITIITASTGRQELIRCVQSVKDQTYDNIQHLVVMDGDEAFFRFLKHEGHRIILKTESPKVDVVGVPYSIGKDRWNGHRIYAAGTYMAEGDYVMFLDDDNFIDPDHVESCVRVIESGSQWSFAFRKIVNADGTELCKDNCESLGKWPSVLSEQDYFVDVNCHCWPKMMAVAITPFWYRKFREPGQPEIDRVLTAVARQMAPNYESNYKYSVNYLVASNSVLSVKPEFFLQGNEEMLRRYNGVLPWVK